MKKTFAKSWQTIFEVRIKIAVCWHRAFNGAHEVQFFNAPSEDFTWNKNGYLMQSEVDTLLYMIKV